MRLAFRTEGLQERHLDSFTPIGVCWEMLFERCLMPERQAAKAVEVNAIDQIDTTPAKDSLAA